MKFILINLLFLFSFISQGSVSAQSNMVVVTTTIPVTTGNCDGQLTRTGYAGSLDWYDQSGTYLGNGMQLSNLCSGTYRLSGWVVQVGQQNQFYERDIAIGNLTDCGDIIQVTGGTNHSGFVCDGWAHATTPTVAGFSYLWDNGDTDYYGNEFCPGTHLVEITNVAGCVAVLPFLVIDSSCYNWNAGYSLTTTTSVNSINCNTSVTVNNNTNWVDVGGLSYSWNNGATTQTITDLCSGTYIVYVSSNYGCLDTLSITVLDSVNNPCSGFGGTVYSNPNYSNCNGGAQLYFANNFGLSYLWSNGATTQSVSNLCAGSYSVTVTNSNGCVETYTTTVQDSSYLDTTNNSCIYFTGNVTTTPVSDNMCNGTASVVMDGINQGILTYLWSNGATTQTINSLCAGAYTVYVSSDLGCLDTLWVTVLDSVNNPCSGFGGAVYSNPNYSNCNGGAQLYFANNFGLSYLWSNGTTTQSVSNLCAGSYSVTVTNSIGCVETYATTVQDSSYIDTNYNPCIYFNGNVITTPSASNTCSGTASAMIYGINQGVLTYLWSTGATTQTISNLCAGNYNVVVTNCLGCSVQLGSNVSSDSNSCQGFGGGITTIENTNNANCNGSVAVYLSNPQTSNLSILWSNGSTSWSLSNLCSGSYSVVVTDSLGCSFQASAILQDSLTNNLQLNVLNSSIVYPNPFTETVKVTFDEIADYSVELFDVSGRLVFKQLFEETNTFELNNLKEMSSGEYLLHIRQGEYLLVKKLIK
jgi:hypothetical protein